MSPITKVPVLIAGGGPTGLTMTSLLARAGVASMVVERRTSGIPEPRGHVINTRSMEIFRELGLAETLEAQSMSMEKMAAIVFCTRVNGRELGRMDAAVADMLERRLAFSATRDVNAPQHHLDPILKAYAEAQRTCELRYGQELVSFEQDDDGVVASLRDVTSGSVSTVRAQYLVAADGASSPVRTRLGIAMDGPRALGRFINIHVEADLRPYLKTRPGLLCWFMNADVIGTMVGFDLEKEWLFILPLLPGGREEDYTDARCIELVRKAVGVDDLPVQLKTVGRWTMSAQVAARFRDRRVFLAGDAAHRFPPTGGLGMNTGIQDAHNLAWKIAAVEQGRARHALLDTYEEERRPVAIANCRFSLQNYNALNELFQALGGNPGPMVSFASSKAGRLIPDVLWRAAVSLGMRRMRSRLTALEAGAASELESHLAVAVENQRPHFDELGQELGFRYNAGALCPEQGAPETSSRNYVPNTWPGARLPHVWLEQNGRRISTHDLIAPNAFVLITRGAGDRWRAAARAASSDVEIRVVAIGPDVDPAQAWAAVSGVQTDGAVLVRPDGHIGWRAQRLPADPAATLAAVIGEILRRPIGIAPTAMSRLAGSRQ